MDKKKDKRKISINANPAGTLEIHEYFDRLAEDREKQAANKKNKPDMEELS